MQFICTAKKVASLNPWRQNAKWRKSLTDSSVTEPTYIHIPIFLHIPRAHEQGFTRGLQHYLVYGRPKQIPNYWVKQITMLVGWHGTSG